MTAYNGNMIYYDGLTELGKFQVGNPTTYYNGTAWTFTWEHGRQLATITQTSTGTTWTNTYNSDGLRTSRSDGTTTYTYIYEDGRLSAIKRNDLNMWIIYDDNGPVTLKYGSGTFHYVTNPQGDVVAIVGNQGQKLVEYTYDAWGKVTSITGDYAYNLGVHNPILYRGYIYDHETGLYYCQSRYYDPETHRFLNADSFSTTGQGFVGNNMFAYCLNNPITCHDNNGQRADSYAGWAGEEFGELIYEWITGDDHPYHEIEQTEREILQKQTRMVGKGTKAVWDAYLHGINHQQDSQLQNSTALLEGVNYFIDHPKQAETVFRDMAGTSIALYALVSAALTGGSFIIPAGAVLVAVWDLSWTFGEIIEDFQ